MSAYLVGAYHVDALIRAALDGPADRGPKYPGDGWPRPYWRGAPLTPQQADELAAALLAENVASVTYRYRGEDLDTLPGPNDKSAYLAALLGEYRYRRPRRHLTAVETLKACDGYEYQSCEHEGWAASDARAFCDALRGRMIASLPGYQDAATWEVSAGHSPRSCTRRDSRQ